MSTRSYGRRWLHGMGRLLIAGALAAISQLAFANSDYVDAWGPAIGSKAPLLAATDQDGAQQALDTLAGPSGLLVVFNRSVDW